MLFFSSGEAKKLPSPIKAVLLKILYGTWDYKIDITFKNLQLWMYYNPVIIIIWLCKTNLKRVGSDNSNDKQSLHNHIALIIWKFKWVQISFPDCVAATCFLNAKSFKNIFKRANLNRD